MAKNNNINKVLKVDPNGAVLISGDMVQRFYPSLNEFSDKKMDLTTMMVFCHLYFLINNRIKKGKGSVRFSYSRLSSSHFPHMSKRGLFDVIALLKAEGFLTVESTKRINVYHSTPLGQELYDTTKQKSKWIAVSPALAGKIGLLPTMLLSLIHYRGRDKGRYTASYTYMHESIFNFVSLSTLKRAMKKLIGGGFLLVNSPAEQEDEFDDLVEEAGPQQANAYTVDYQKVQSLFPFLSVVGSDKAVAIG